MTASTISCVASAKKNAMPISLTRNDSALGEREVAFGGAVRPDQGDRRAERQQQEAIEEMAVPAMAEPRADAVGASDVR